MQEDKPAERRVAEAPAIQQLERGKGRVVVSGGRADRVMIGEVGLQDAAPAHIATPRPAEHLGEQLEGALGGARVGKVEQGVRVHHADQGHARKIEALRDHLRPDDHLRVA